MSQFEKLLDLTLRISFNVPRSFIHYVCVCVKESLSNSHESTCENELEALGVGHVAADPKSYRHSLSRTS